MNKWKKYDSLKVATANMITLDAKGELIGDVEYNNLILEENEIFESFNMDIFNCLEIAMAWRDMDEKEIADWAGIDDRTVKRIKGRENMPKPRTLALICLALKLPYRMSSHMFNCAGYRAVRMWNKKGGGWDYQMIFIENALRNMIGEPRDVIVEYFDTHIKE